MLRGIGTVDLFQRDYREMVARELRQTSIRWKEQHSEVPGAIGMLFGGTSLQDEQR